MGNIGRAFEWTTPLGLPVVQPYMKWGAYDVSARTTRGVTLAPEDRIECSRPLSKKQMQAMPPNYIHSIDSTHMMLTAVHCQHEHIPFAAVHDCYWTLGPYVDRMNVTCRREFVRLHELPLLDTLSQQMCDTYVPQALGTDAAEYARTIYTSVPVRGTFDIRQVIDSKYFFS
jgi:DNA-directed RNA polymerase